MTIAQADTDVVSLTPSSEETIYAPLSTGGAVVLLDIRDMASTDAFILRHYVNFDADGTTIVGSKTIVQGTTTDEQWSDGSVAGDPDALGWTSWPLGFGSGGGIVTIESTSGSYDIEFIVLDLGGPTG